MFLWSQAISGVVKKLPRNRLSPRDFSRRPFNAVPPFARRPRCSCRGGALSNYSIIVINCLLYDLSSHWWNCTYNVGGESVGLCCTLRTIMYEEGKCTRYVAIVIAARTLVTARGIRIVIDTCVSFCIRWLTRGCEHTIGNRNQCYKCKLTPEQTVRSVAFEFIITLTCKKLLLFW